MLNLHQFLHFLKLDNFYSFLFLNAFRHFFFKTLLFLLRRATAQKLEKLRYQTFSDFFKFFLFFINNLDVMLNVFKFTLALFFNGFRLPAPPPGKEPFEKAPFLTSLICTASTRYVFIKFVFKAELFVCHIHKDIQRALFKHADLACTRGFVRYQ